MSSKSYRIFNFIGEIILIKTNLTEIIIYFKQDVNETIPPIYSNCIENSLIQCDVIESIELPENYKQFLVADIVELNVLLSFFEFKYYNVATNGLNELFIHIKKYLEQQKHIDSINHITELITKLTIECNSYDEIKTKYSSEYYELITIIRNKLNEGILNIQSSNIMIDFTDRVYNSSQFTQRLIHEKYNSSIPMTYERDVDSNYCHKIKMKNPLSENLKVYSNDGTQILYERLHRPENRNDIMYNFNIKTQEEFDSIIQAKIEYDELLSQSVKWPKIDNPKQIKIMNKLGQGSFGSIYMGIYDNKKYAIKFMESDHQTIQNKMLYYSSVLCQLYEMNDDIKTIDDAPIINWAGNSNKLFNLPNNNGIYALIMEMADRTLSSVIDESVSYPTTDLRFKNKTLMTILYNLGNDLIKVFNSIHNVIQFMKRNDIFLDSTELSKGLLYIDLKPGNIMLDKNNNIKLIDIDSLFNIGHPMEYSGSPAWTTLCSKCDTISYCDDYEILLFNVIDLAIGINIVPKLEGLVRAPYARDDIINARKIILKELLQEIDSKKSPNYLDNFIKSLIELIFEMQTMTRTTDYTNMEIGCKYKDNFKNILTKFKIDMDTHTNRSSRHKSVSIKKTVKPRKSKSLKSKKKYRSMSKKK